MTLLRVRMEKMMLNKFGKHCVCLGFFLVAELIWSLSHSAVPPWLQRQVSPAGEEQNIEVAD